MSTAAAAAEEGGKIQKLLVMLQHSRLEARLQALSGIADCLIDHTQLELKAPPLKKLVRAIVVASLEAYAQLCEKKWRLALIKLLVRAASLTDLPFSVIECALEVMQLRQTSGAIDDDGRAGLIDVALALMPTLLTGKDADSAKITIMLIVAEQFLLIQDMRLEKTTKRLLANALSVPASPQYDAFATVCLASSADQQTAGSGLAFVAAASLFPLIHQHAGNSNELRLRLIDAYSKRIAQAKAPQLLPTASLRKLKGFFQMISSAEWSANGAEEGLEASLLRTVRKAPEGSALLVAAAASQANVATTDLSGFAQGGAAASALRMLRSQVVDVRFSGRALLMNLAAKSGQPEAAAHIVQLAVEALQGKGSGGALTQAWQRGEVANVMCVLADTLGAKNRGNAASLASSALPALLAAVDKESIDEVRALLASAAGKWLALLDTDMPIATIDAFRGGLGKVKSQSYLLAMAQAVISSGSHVVEKLVPVVLPLCVTIAIKKPTAATQVDTLLSLRLVAECCVLSAEASTAAEAHKLWNILTVDGSLVFNKALHAPAVESSDAEIHSSSVAFIDAPQFNEGGRVFVELLAQSQLAILALATQLQLSPAFSSGELPRGAVDCLLSCFLHPYQNVRKNAAQTATTLVSTNPRALKTLMHALLDLLNTIAADSEASEAAALHDFKTSKDEAASARLPAVSWAAEALLSLCSAAATASSAGQQIKVEVLFAPALLLCSHPLVSERSVSRAARLWTLVRDSFSIGDSSLPATDLVQRLLQACQSDSEASRGAGKCAIVLLALRSEAWGRELVRATILPALVSGLGCEALAAVSDEDAAGFLNPQAAIAAAIANVSEVVVDLRITNADRKKEGPRSSRKGTFGSDFVEDEEWAERVRAEKIKKAQQAQTGGGGDDPSAKKKKELDQLAARLSGLVNGSRRVLATLAWLARASSANAGKDTAVSEAIGLLLPVLLQLLRSPLVEAEALNALQELCSTCLQVDLKPAAIDLALSLRLVATIVSTGELIAPPTGSQGKRAARELQEWQLKHRRLVDFSGPFVRLFKHLATSMSRGAATQSASLATLQLCFPVFRGLLQLPSLVPGCELVLTLFSSIWPTSSLPEELRPVLSPALEGCLVALGNLRIVDPTPETLFLRIVQQERCLASQDWAPLLGDHGLLSASANVRLACVRALVISGEASIAAPNATSELRALLPSRLFLAMHDNDDAVKSQAGEAWTAWLARRPQLLPLSFLESFLSLLAHEVSGVRDSAARALAGGLMVFPESSSRAFNEIQAIYKQALPPAPSKSDRDVLVPSKKGADTFLTKKGAPAPSLLSEKSAVIIDDEGVNVRMAVATTLSAIGLSKTLYDASGAASGEAAAVISQMLEFLLSVGVVDSSGEVRAAMIATGRDFVDGFADTQCAQMMVALDTVLKRKQAKDEDVAAHDRRYEAAVVLLGVAGKHLGKDDPAVLTIAETLIAALSIPSEPVQRAVAECLSPLVAAAKGSERLQVVFGDLMLKVTDAGSYGERRGAAFGLSALVKGLGITSLRQHDVVNRLREACENGSVNARQGAFGAFECLSDRLGMLFEPYITTIVPVLLKSFSHASDHVREAAQGAAKAIMGRLSAHGVKVVLTPILTSLPTETAWKTRQEAIRLLGTMAHCAPKQLAQCLPQIVPRLVEAGYDPHPKVKEAAKSAMGDISSVIKNPEVARLAPVLLAALGDPANKTKEALEALLECEFMHSIDAPSLALLVPILARALRDRGADLKRKSAAITGNMMTMVGDPKFMSPYLPQVMPGLRDCLLDPIPDVRATSAKALGSLVAGVGEEDELKELVPWLTATLCTEASPVERSGAAQGLSEVCLAMGAVRLEMILQQTLPLHLSSKAAAREGLLWLLSFLPAAMREAFSPHIAATLPVVLSGLADGTESVREVAMRAGQIMVATLGKTHTLELLPSLCEGMFDDDWHIRHSSVMLLGELLYLIGDTKASGLIGADGDDEGDDEGGGVGSTSRVSITIRVHLGSQNTDAMLASLYIARSDVSAMVRQSALQVWKSVVSNTPRTLVEIMNELVQQLVLKLSADSPDMRVVAGRALGEVVRKLGDRVLPAVVPHLRTGLEGGDLRMREGVCLGLAEILQASTRRQIEDYITVLVPALQQGLCDPSEVVRSQAARAFQTLCKALGPRAIEDVLPTLVEQVAQARAAGVEQNMPMLGLREIVQAKPRDILEYLLPRLLSSPMSAGSAFVLGSVADVSGAVLQYHFGLLLPSFSRELQMATESIASSASDESILSAETDRLAALKECASCVMGSITTAGVNFLCGDLGKQIEDTDSVTARQWGCWLLEQFVRRSKAHYQDYIQILLKYLLSRVAETDRALLQAVSDALAGMGAALDVDVLVTHIDFIRSCISSTASDAKHSTTGHLLAVSTSSGEVQLPLFSVPKALEPLLAIFIHGVMNGNPSVRENAADGIGELAVLTEPSALKPYLIKSTGPLIRVVGDRIPSNVKTSILQTLGILLDKGGPSLKAFAPQLQTTFVKALSDPSRQTRGKAVLALGKLMSISLRVDPLLAELSALCSTAESNAIRCSAIDALATVLAKGGSSATPPALEKVKSCVYSFVLQEDEALRTSASQVCGYLAAYASDSLAVADIVMDLADLRGLKTEQLYSMQGRILSIARIIQNSGSKKLQGSIRADAFAYLAAAFQDEKLFNTCCSALVIATTLPDTTGTEDRADEYREVIQSTFAHFASSLCAAAAPDRSEETRKLALTAIKQAAQANPESVRSSFAKSLLPPLLAAFRETMLFRVKALAERAFYYLSDGANEKIISAFAALSDGNEASFMRDYAKRVISKLPKEEEEEEDVW